MKTMILLLLLISIQVAYSQWEPCNKGLFGGNVQCIATNNDLIVIGTKNGVYFSTDKGESWAAKNYGLFSLNIKSLLMKEGLLFAGTDGGLFKSTNQGELWIRQNDITNAYIITLACKDNSIFAGTDFNGLYISSDNGSTWEKKVVTPATSGGLLSIAFKGDTIYTGLSNAGLYSSTDNGENWTENNEHRFDISVRCLVVRGNNIFVSSPTALFRSNDNCKSWTTIPVGNIKSIIYDDNKLYTLSNFDILSSTDNGDSYTPISENISGSAKLCIAKYNDELFVGTERGILNTKENSTTWTFKNNGLANTELTSMTFIDSTIFAGTYGNGVFQSTTNGKNWTEINSGFYQNSIMANRIMVLSQKDSDILAGTNGDGMYLLAAGSETWIKKWKKYDPQENDVFQISSIVSNDNSIYVGTYIGLYSSNDNGTSWIKNNIGTDKKIKITALGKNKDGIFAGTLAGVYFSSDNGTTWIEKNSGLESKSIYSFESIDNKVFVSTDRCGLYILSEDGSRWDSLSKVSDSYQPINRIAVKDDIILAQVGKSGIFISSNNGITWKDASFELPINNINSLKFIGDFVFVGTFGNGLFRAKISDLLYAVGVEENSTNTDNYLYTFPPIPNPATKEVRSLVYWDMSSDIEQDEIGIYNIYGAKVSDRSKISFDKLSSYNGYLIWNCAGMETGVYFIVIKHGTATRTIKVMVN